MSPRRFDRSEKYTSRRDEIESIICFPGRNNTLFARICPRNEGIIGFNLDEVGILEWEDRQDKKVIVPKMIAGQTIYHHASRNVKHISIITYITLAGESLMPYIMTSQDSESLHSRLMSRDVRLGAGFVLR
jgi:hypothetical protein